MLTLLTKFCAFAIQVIFVFLALSPLMPSGFGLDEEFDLYRAPQSLGMGNALTADTFGYAALFHNPAGLSVYTKKRWELNAFDVEGAINIATISRSFSSLTLGMYRMFGDLKKNPGTYANIDIKTVPSFTIRGFGVALIGSHRFAGISDGTNLDMLGRQDVGLVTGYSHFFAGNVIKMGISAKILSRNEMKGNFSHAELESRNEDTFAYLFKEGLAVGADVGAIVTIPSKWLPTLGVAWLDVMDTHFYKANIRNSKASGVPDSIKQSVNVAFSVHPILSRRLKSTFSAEYKHLEKTNLTIRKHLHFGLQIEDDKSLYVWAGLNHFYPCFALGYRVAGGNLEVGTYGEDIGAGQNSKLDQRVFFRYTIGY